MVVAEGISTHTLLAEGDDTYAKMRRYRKISTHTLLAEGDFPIIADKIERLISTHTLLAEGDLFLGLVLIFLIDFNPHPPRGG